MSCNYIIYNIMYSSSIYYINNLRINKNIIKTYLYYKYNDNDNGNRNENRNRNRNRNRNGNTNENINGNTINV